MKTCPHCRQTTPNDKFSKNVREKDGLQGWCKSCQKSAKKVYYRLNKLRLLRRNKENRAELRKKFFRIYGQMCHCGETREVFLTLDHVVPLRARTGRGEASYRDAIREYNPKKYQVLCMNCNFLKRHRDKCPCGFSAPSLDEWIGGTD